MLVLLVVLVVLLLWSLISPRSQWRVLAAWVYRDQDANEPSDLAYGAGRVVSAVALVVLVVVAVRLNSYAGDDDPVGSTSTTRTQTFVDAAPDLVGYRAPRDGERLLGVVVAWPESEFLDLDGGTRVLCSSRARVVEQTATRVVLDVSASAQVSADQGVEVSVDDVRRRCAAAAGDGVVGRVGLDAPLGDREVAAESPTRGADGALLGGDGPFPVVELSRADDDGPSSGPSS